jgi:CheY-like chemotaxis protein
MNAELVPSADSPETGEERIRVLIVEDDPVVRRLLRFRLHKAGVAALSVASGEEAVALTKDDTQPFHLVITDGVMPGMDGFDVARYFARCEPPVRVVLVSGYLNHFVSRSDMPTNIAAFFGKPFSTNELIAKVLDLVGMAAG